MEIVSNGLNIFRIWSCLSILVATAPPSTTTERTHETCSGTEYLTANYNPEILSTPNYPDTYPK